MDNDLLNVKKNLRTIAKRYKSVNYSIGMAIMFLMMGVGAFAIKPVNIDVKKSEIVNEKIRETEKNILTTTEEVKQLFMKLKKDNRKLIKNSNLTLIKLME